VVLPALSLSGRLRWLPDGPREPVRAGAGAPARPTSPAGPGGSGVDVLLVPALAVDTLGRRIGWGHDRYDEIVRQAGSSTLVIAVVHDGDLWDAAVEPIPEEPHDRRVDMVVTPTRALLLPPGMARRGVLLLPAPSA